MSIEPRNQNGNILIRHLHRHHQISTLFRSVETGTAGRLPRRAGMDLSPALPVGQVVTARLVFSGPDLPWGDLIPVEAMEGGTPSQQVEGFRPAPAPGTSRSSQPAADVSQPGWQGPSSQEKGKPEYEETAPSTDDLAWQRLNAIHRSLQEQVQQEAATGAASSYAGGAESLLQRQPETPAKPGGPAFPQPGRAQAGQPPARQASTRPAAPVSTSLPPVEHRSDSKITDADWQRLEAISRAHEEKEQRERAALSQKVQKTPETQAPVQTTPAVPFSTLAPAAAKPVQERPKTVGEVRSETGKPPVPKIEELPAVEEQRQPVEVSSPPAGAQPQPSRVQRAWQQLQNVFGKHAENEPREPGVPTEQAGSPSMESAGGEKPSPADVQLKPSTGQDRSTAAREGQAGKPVEEGPVPQRSSVSQTPGSPVENAVPETAKGEDASYKEENKPIPAPANLQEEPAGESQSLARPESENTIEYGATTSDVKLEVESGEPETSPKSTGHTAVIQPKEAGSREPSPRAKSLDVTGTPQQPAAVLPLEPTLQQEPELDERGSESEAIETPADELQTQSLPLEEVWPVERLEQKSPMNVQKVETSPTLIQAQPVELPVEETAQVQKLLQDVQPGQPTDSKLEVVTPRRPRPPVPAVDQGDNQGRIPGAVEAATPEPPVIQRSPESELSSPETLSPGQAPAGLNPELAQLWGMLDEIESDQSRLAIPASTDRPAPHESVTVSKEAGPAIQRAEQPAQPAVRSVYDENYPAARSPETSEIMSPPETPLVQRQDAAPASASQPAPEAGEAAGQPGKPDIDELARQVYAEVRRKLALEWERMRR